LEQSLLLSNFENASLAQLEAALRCVKSQRMANRLLAIRALAKTIARKTVAAVFQITERTLGLWIKAFNSCRIDGLLEAPRSGRIRILCHQEFIAKVLPLLEDPVKVDPAHWTGVKLHGYLRQLCLALGYSTLLRQLHHENWVLRIPGPWPAPPKDDVWEEKRAAFLPGFLSLLQDARARVFFGDKCGDQGRSASAAAMSSQG
jgi:transposase